MRGMLFRLVILLSLFFVTPVLSALEDFEYSSPSSIKACACSNFVTQGEITNLGDVTSHYILSSAGNASSWVQIVPNNFALEPLEKKRVKVFYNIPCETQGVFSLNTNINSNLGLYKVHYASVDVSNCDVIILEPVITENSECRGNYALYQFNIRNNGLLLFEEMVVPQVSEEPDFEYKFDRPYYLAKTTDVGSIPIYLHISSQESREINVKFKAMYSGFTYNVPVKYNAIECGPKSYLNWRNLGEFLIIIAVGLLGLVLILIFIVLLMRAMEKKSIVDRIERSERRSKSEEQGLDSWIEPKKKEEKKTVKKAVKKVVKPESRLLPLIIMSIILFILLLLAGVLLYLFFPAMLLIYLVLVGISFLIILLMLLLKVLGIKGKDRSLKEWLTPSEEDIKRKEEQRKLKEKEKRRKEAEKRSRLEEKRKKREEKRRIEEERRRIEEEARRLRAEKRRIAAEKRRAEKRRLKEAKEQERRRIKESKEADALLKSKERMVVSKKKVSIEAKKKLKKKPKKKWDKKTKNFMTLLLLIIILILLLGLMGWLIYYFWSDITGFIAETNMTEANESMINESIKPGDLEDQVLMPNISDEPQVQEPDIGNVTGNVTNINLLNPVIGFFSDYGVLCTFIITFFIVLFVISLLFIGMREKRKWSKRRKQIFKYRYLISLVLFICVVFSFLFCVFNNTCDDTLRCVTMTLEDVEETNISEVNISEVMTDKDLVIEKQSCPECLCNTLFGIGGIWCILLIILLILLAYGMIHLYRKPKKVKESKKIEKIEKKVERKIKKKDEKKGMNIWKDILLLLILLLLLAAIGAFFYYYKPFALSTQINATNQTNMTNETRADIEDTDKVKVEEEIKPNEVVKDEEEIIYTTDKDLICEVTFPEFEREGDIILEEDYAVIDKSPYDLAFKWYLDRGEGFKIFNEKTNRVVADDTEVDDHWICEATLILDNRNITVNSSPYSVIPEEAVLEPADIPEAERIDEIVDYIEENNLTGSFDYFIMDEGGILDINLTHFFIDPDNDTLMFSSATRSENITIDIWKGVATVQASEGFIGTANVTFFAEDPSGEIASGNTTIIVKAKEQPVSGLLSGYKWYVVVGLAILLILIIILSLYDYYHDKKRQKKKQQGFFKNF